MKSCMKLANAGIAGLSLSVLVACGGGSSGGGEKPIAPDDDPTRPDTMTDTMKESGGPIGTATQTGPFSGPRLYQTGNTAVSGTQNNVGIGFTIIPNFTYTTDTSTNTTGDGLPSNNLPDVVYDEKGRGIELKVTASGAPYVVSYNDDDSIAAITRTNSDGLVSQITFNYENGRLVSKSTTSQEDDGSVSDGSSVSYAYTADGLLKSAEVTTVFGGFLSTKEAIEFTADATGRISVVKKFDRDGDLKDEYVMSYDASGNIVAVDLYRGDRILFVARTYVYAASAEPTVNLFGFLAAINDGFIPEFDLFLL